jgi:hypothetical protein
VCHGALQVLLMIQLWTDLLDRACIGQPCSSMHSSFNIAVSDIGVHNETSFSPNSIDSLCLQVAQVPRSQDMAIFVSADRQTN